MIPRPLQVIVRLLAAATGGAAIASAFPPISFWPGVIIGVTLVLTAVAGVGVRLALLSGLVAGVTGHALAFAWLWSVLARFTQATAPATSAYIAAFVVYHAGQLSLFALAASRRAGRDIPPLRRSAGAAAAWVVLEWCFPKVIPWSLADGLAGAPVLRQASDIAGPHGLSFMIVAISASLAATFDATAPRRRRLRAAVTVAITLSVMVLYGSARIAQFTGERTVATLRVTLAQGRVGLHDDPHLQTELAWRIYEPLSLSALGDFEADGLVIWPETTLRVHLRHDERQLLRAQRLVARLKQPLLLGTLDLPAAGGGELNAAVLLLPEAAGSAPPVQVYGKRWLLPFAEYVPGAEVLDHLKSWPTTGRFVEGEPGAPLDLGTGMTLAPAICFEALRPGVFNSMVRAGAGLIVNLSDDGWFAGTAEPQQHLLSATMRAVETRRWLVRSSDSGISAIIDPTGRIVQQLDFGAVGSLQAEVPLETGHSMYVWLGDWMVPVCVLIAVVRLRRPA